MQELIKLQRQYFDSNATKPIQFWIAQLKQLRDVIMADEDLLQDAIYKDYGKTGFPVRNVQSDPQMQ